MTRRIQSATLLPVLVVIVCLQLPLTARCETLFLKQPSGLLATAEFLPGEPDKRAVLILHGFLQTRDFFTVRRMGEALHDLGYSVLLPNLTLSIDNRRQSLACEAIHTHSLEQDVQEIGTWVEWLYRRSGRPVTLIGHSIGSLELLAYLSESSPRQAVDQAIMVSLIAFAQGPIAKENETERQRALQQLAQGDDAMSAYRLAFCDSYNTTAGNYLSYLSWNGKKTVEKLKSIELKPLIVLGGEDRRLGDDWLPALRQTGAEVVLIPGANHFFDHEYEFYLTDTLVELLER